MWLLKTPHTSVQTWRNPDGTDLEVSSLLASFRSDRRCYSGHRRRKDISGLTHQWIMPALIINCLARCTSWYNSGLMVMGVTSRLLLVFEACATVGNLCLVLYLVKSLCLEMYRPWGRGQRGELLLFFAKLTWQTAFKIFMFTAIALLRETLFFTGQQIHHWWKSW